LSMNDGLDLWRAMKLQYEEQEAPKHMYLFSTEIYVKHKILCHWFLSYIASMKH
jgi:hypothetical protein